jgi:hypothetical protein
MDFFKRSDRKDSQRFAANLCDRLRLKKGSSRKSTFYKNSSRLYTPKLFPEACNECLSYFLLTRE